ncbi:MAG: hypothetical protein BGN96_15705 [Bacteroidales bacterium 45-6]|nr:MAG: hypothetical protein BGN96_15705 [Bacteroidales bacterium 45-6]
MKYKKSTGATPLRQENDKTFSDKQEQGGLLPYVRPRMDIHYVVLENSIMASSIAINNTSGNVKEDWGNENNYNNDINFTN